MTFWREKQCVNTRNDALHLPIARIFYKVLALENAEPEELSLAIDAAIQAEIPILKRFNNVFENIITLAPLLGLLGTVLETSTSTPSPPTTPASSLPSQPDLKQTSESAPTAPPDPPDSALTPATIQSTPESQPAPIGKPIVPVATEP